MKDWQTEYIRAALQSEETIRTLNEAIGERARLIASMLTGPNETAKTQALAAIERACRAEEVLAAVRELPSQSDLLTNAVARAMYETATRGMEP